jgi:hypothetical protein
MRKFLSLAATFASVFAVGSAQANVILIDNFNTPSTSSNPQRARDTSTGNGPNSSGTVTISGGLAIDRQLFSDLIAGSGDSPTSTLTAGGPNQNGNQVLDVTNSSSSVNSINYVKWNLGTITATQLFGSVSLYFDVTTPSGSGPATVAFDIAGTSLDFSTSLGTLGHVAFALDSNDIAAFGNASGKLLTMKITGANGYDLRLNNFGLEIPEPTSLALVGLALVGAGFAASRRKA